MASCLMILSDQSSSFWAEAIMTANHVQNRSRSKALLGKTPYVEYVQVLGIKAYVLDKTLGKDKFQVRANKGILWDVLKIEGVSYVGQEC